MNCQHIPTSTVKSVTCCKPPPEERKLPGPALSSTPSTMPRGWLLWSGSSGLHRCCSPRRTSTSSLLERDENWLDRKWCLVWYVMLGSVSLGPDSDHLHKEGLQQGRSTRQVLIRYFFLFRSYIPEKFSVNQILVKPIFQRSGESSWDSEKLIEGNFYLWIFLDAINSFVVTSPLIYYTW